MLMSGRYKEQDVYTCVICHFATECDDVVVATVTGGCVCLRCYARETATELVMPKALRRDLADVLSGLTVGS
jgi:hypothetical protein